MAEKSGDSEFTCYYPGCGRSFTYYKNLLPHYQLEKLHKSTENLKKRPLSAKQAVVEFLPELPAVRRQARVKEIVKCVTADELHNLVLPHLIGVISPWQFLLEKVSRTSVAVGLPQAILHELGILKQTACQALPETVPFLHQAPQPSSVHLPVTCVNTDDKQNFMSICMRNEQLISDWLCSFKTGKIVTNHILPHLYEHQNGAFLDFACGLVTDFGISQKGIQETLLARDEIVSTLKPRKDLVAKKVGLKFSEIGPVIVGYTNVKQHIEFLLSQPGLDGVADLPNKTLLILC